MNPLSIQAKVHNGKKGQLPEFPAVVTILKELGWQWLQQHFLKEFGFGGDFKSNLLVQSLIRSFESSLSE